MANLSLTSAPSAGNIPDIDDIPDMEEDDLEGADDAAAAPAATAGPSAVADDTSNANLLQVRTYDVMITYDKHYQTPRIWLYGYDEVSRLDSDPQGDC